MIRRLNLGNLLCGFLVIVTAFATRAEAQCTGGAPIIVSAGPGSVTCSTSETSTGSGVWNVNLVVKMDDADVTIVTIVPSAFGVKLGRVEVSAIALATPPSSATVVLRIEEPGTYSFDSVESIVRVPQSDPDKRDDVRLFVDISGSLGESGGGGEVIVTRIDRLRCVGDITFDTITIVEPETSQVEYSEITLVESVNGSIFSDILIPRVGGVPAPDIRVVRVLAENGDIGHAGTGGLVVIESTASVERIQAQNIYAHINAAVDGLHFSGCNGVLLTWSSSGL